MQETPTETVVPLTRPPRELALGTLVGGRYEVVAALGSGGYGVVYRARDRRLRRDIALKVLRDDRLSESAKIRFRREVQVARDVVAPQLLRVFDIGDDEEIGLTYLTMELVRGETLRALLRRERLTVEKAVRVAGEVLRALALLHGEGILHRDVKPGNILLDGEGGVKLADFGLARRWDSDETRATETSSLVGTLEYVSPEQALGKEIGPRSDLFALGVVFFEMLAGRLPYEGASSLGTLLAHIRKSAEDVRRHRPEVPAWLAAVVARLLEKDPADRFGTAQEVLAALAGRRTAWRHRFGVLRRRRWRWALAAAAVLAVVVGGGALRLLGPEEPTLAVNANGETEAQDHEGRILWRKRLRDAQPARIHRGQAPRVLALTEDSTRPGQLDMTTFGIFDLRTGDLLARKPITRDTETFSVLGFSERMLGVQLLVCDLDGDGFDEALFQYVHRTQWPSFVTLYEPRLERQRVVFRACGHHTFLASADLDGDGNLELLLTGIANCLGWKRGLAAVSLDPPLNEPGPTSPNRPTAPGLPLSSFVSESLNWYALLPVTACTLPECIRIDRQGRTIEIRNNLAQEPMNLGFDGFRRGVAHTATGKRRQELRRNAYIDLAEAQRLLGTGLPEEALVRVRKAQEAAAAAGEVDLLEWLRRVEAQTLVAARRPGEAEELVREVIARSESPGDAAYDLATALHVAGYLESAADWYDYGLGQAGDIRLGRFKFEFLFNLVLVLAELEKWEEARAAIERYEETVGYGTRNASYYAYLDWRRGELSAVPETGGPGEYDLYRYWRLEFRRALGEGPKELLPDIDQELLMTSEEYRALVRMLKAELLVEAGKLGEAVSLARRAYSEAQNDIRSYPVARSHFDIVARRWAAVERAAGDEVKAARVEEELRRWQAEQMKRRDFRPAAGGH